MATTVRIVAVSNNQADQVIVVDNGKIVGAGTHEALLADCPTYAEFASSQSMGAEVGGAQ